MNETTKAFSDAFAAYIDAKRKLIKENVPYYIRVNPNYFKVYLEKKMNQNGKCSITLTDGMYYIYKDFMNHEYEVPLIIDNKVDTYEEVYQD